MTRTVHLVPHTHWDREWYLPFQSFRLRLVDLVDRVLELMDADRRFAFTLDGQLATVDDYLEIRPQAEPRIARLIEEGRLAVGPWQVLMDEFLVSGETIVRNLEAGWRRAEELGGGMAAGYLPDMFGHIAQMPQILRRAGIEHAAVWRGVPAAIDRHAFRWEAPDGSAVRAEYLVGGYFNAAYLLAVPGRLAAKVELLHEALARYFDDDPLLAMYGTDHSEPLPELIELADDVNRAQDRYVVRIGTLRDYLLGSGGADGLPSWRGELRSAAHANMLAGVASARIDLKAAAARAERLLERYAEPLQALYGGAWPREYLDLAWRRVVENSAHDSICGCSADAVCQQVLVRFAEAEQIAGGLAERAASAVARRVPRTAVAVFNPSPRERVDLVELDLAIPGHWEDVALALPGGDLLPTQEVGRQDPLLVSLEVTGERIPAFLERRVHGRELFRRWLNGYRIEDVEGVRRLTLEVADEPDPPWLDVDELKRELEVAALAAGGATWEIRIETVARRRLLANVPAPALGWTSAEPVPHRARLVRGVECETAAMRNGLLEVAVCEDGTLRVDGNGVRLRGAGRLVEGGDAGDSYNYAPPPADVLVERPERVDVELRAAGPLRGELAVRRRYRWPLGLEADAASRTRASATVDVTTSVELRAGEPFLRLRVSFDNRCSDHRLRFHVPLARDAAASAAEGQFAVVERGLAVEGGYGEAPLPTFPAHGFVDAGGVAVLLDHVLEYELLDGRELALSLLRGTGLISRNTNRYREDPAGPEVEIPGGQCRGPWSVGLGLYPHPGSWHEDDVLAQLERYRYPFLTAPGTAAAAGERGPATGLEVRGEGVVLSSLRRRDDWLELRLVRERPGPGSASVAGDFREAREADLLGRAGAGLPLRSEGVLELELGAWEIRTLQLRR